MPGDFLLFDDGRSYTKGTETMTKTRHILTNDFHNTATAVVATNGKINARQARRAWHNLCGIDGCTCGGPAGERGGNWFVRQADAYGETYNVEARA